jgi:dephospho-CoA kinase
MGSGKTLSLTILGRLRGTRVLSTDEVGHGLLRRRDIVRKVRRAFGERVFTGARVDRRKLAGLAFGDPVALGRLDRILHPAIRADVARWVSERKRKGDRLLLVEVPLLFEGRFERLFDGVLSISAPAALRRRRAGSRRFAQRSRFQWSQSQKDSRADWVVKNASTRGALKNALQRWVLHMGKGMK